MREGEEEMERDEERGKEIFTLLFDICSYTFACCYEVQRTSTLAIKIFIFIPKQVDSPLLSVMLKKFTISVRVRPDVMFVSTVFRLSYLNSSPLEGVIESQQQTPINNNNVI